MTVPAASTCNGPFSIQKPMRLTAGGAPRTTHTSTPETRGKVNWSQAVQRNEGQREEQPHRLRLGGDGRCASTRPTQPTNLEQPGPPWNHTIRGSVAGFPWLSANLQCRKLSGVRQWTTPS